MDIYRKNKQFYLGLRHIGGGGERIGTEKERLDFYVNMKLQY